jgi:serine/threonine protein kinase
MLPIIGMEPIEGRYLKRHLAANNGATGNNLMKLKVFKDIADAVGEIHKAGYVHRDLKPKNILIEPDEHVRIIDLGITARTGESPKNQYASGTLGYMSPEQHAVMAAHPTMDIYSLGCILYEIVTGKTPLENLEDEVYKRDVDMIEKIDRFIGAKVNDEHLVNPSPRIKRVLDSCNQYIIEILQHTVRGDPSMRYMSCDALSNAVGNIIKKLDHSDRMSRKLNEASLMGRLTRKAHHEPTTPEEQAIDFVMRRKQRGLPNYDQRNAVAYMQQFIDDIMPYLPRINMRMRQLMSESAARKQEYLAYTASLKQESPGTEPR